MDKKPALYTTPFKGLAEDAVKPVLTGTIFRDGLQNMQAGADVVDHVAGPGKLRTAEIHSHLAVAQIESNPAVQYGRATAETVELVQLFKRLYQLVRSSIR